MASLPPSIRIARRITETVLTTWGVPPKTSVHDDAVLAVTEPATNTIRHAALLSPSFELILDVIDDHLDMAVRDSHSGSIELPSREGEGGLAVLADLAHGFVRWPPGHRTRRRQDDPRHPASH